MPRATFPRPPAVYVSGMGREEDLYEGVAATRADFDVVPIFYCEEQGQDNPKILDFAGTGFRLTRDLLVTCWHCVAVDEPGRGYAVPFPEGEQRRMHPLVDVGRDPNGTDLATARIFGVGHDPLLGLRVGTHAAAGGTPVWTYGYPLTETIRDATRDDARILLHPRVLQGYITRAFWYTHPSGMRVPSYELDMPAPAGLSGSPVVTDPGREVLGVVYGTSDVARVEEFASIDPATGEHCPEVHRIVSFALAHFTSTLRDLRGPATAMQSLSELGL